MPNPRFIIYSLDEKERGEIEFMGNEDIINSLDDNTTYVIVDRKNKVLITLLGAPASLKMKFFASLFTVELHRKKYSTYQTTTFDSIDEFKGYLKNKEGLQLTEEELKKFERKIKPKFFKGGA